MATRMAARHISRRLSSSGKVLSEEEKAAENIYIKGPASGTVADAKPSSGSGTSETPNVSTDKHRNYGVVVGIGTALAAFGWYMGSKKKRVEVQD
ncbi:uncharacterized protein At2g27730, mitochondrial-like isoform X2 [Salvia splendens]|uniref:uncharacterized protein At2g27730, mitochondrial-like isoform X2 n=1 Tax=Salvia splendens TaxID=180675 RepID=UPI001C2599F3|nr:uncharacterized protein At2g27730, mitochondrial-like isoform X2 [Salvia splendens]